ncbi:MAG: hypothetical protein ABFQ53_03415, partial [Patescibacteria group bacterium]
MMNDMKKPQNNMNNDKKDVQENVPPVSSQSVNSEEMSEVGSDLREDVYVGENNDNNDDDMRKGK